MIIYYLWYFYYILKWSLIKWSKITIFKYREKINSLRNLEAGWNRVIINGVDIIVYKKSSVLFMPTCININNITAYTEERNNNCFNSIPVKSKYFEKGYLSDKLIVTSTSEFAIAQKIFTYFYRNQNNF